MTTLELTREQRNLITRARSAKSICNDLQPAEDAYRAFGELNEFAKERRKYAGLYDQLREKIVATGVSSSSVDQLIMNPDL
ncbi:MAG: hypothetical protein U0517_03530 [Candidatus Andersenbacteria bacterium]